MVQRLLFPLNVSLFLFNQLLSLCFIPNTEISPISTYPALLGWITWSKTKDKDFEIIMISVYIWKKISTLCMYDLHGLKHLHFLFPFTFPSFFHCIARVICPCFWFRKDGFPERKILWVSMIFQMFVANSYLELHFIQVKFTMMCFFFYLIRFFSPFCCTKDQYSGVFQLEGVRENHLLWYFI